MPLVYQQNINAVTRLGVWHISEDESFFLQRVPVQNEITHAHKRLQHLAGRLLLRELYDDFPIELIRIADTRKPFLPDEEFHFSISHCGDYAAVVASKEYRVGVDIEIPKDKIVYIKNKFLKPEEQHLLNSVAIEQVQAMTMAWSAKEAMFKWYAAGKVDFREHMHLSACHWKNGQFSFDAVFSKEEYREIKVNGFFFNKNCLCWVCT